MNSFELDHCSNAAKERLSLGTPITCDEYKEMRLNWYERKLLLPLMDNNCLIETTIYNLKNCMFAHAGTYEYTLKEHLVPELMRRIKEYEVGINDQLAKLDTINEKLERGLRNANDLRGNS